ncbi:hypothetical protein BCR44DRAFT_1441786 [Catenaria anguillulae PL171]|uniref:G-protein coupled receptors family 2 profile 2 domain-containing protein n=1 Tax=Catenaria anguillulae PL171 TaxID=765915 RepID=A0A1Y2HCS5_9FUNG|nr:hypothetical protein BCR44DRAFT_1441786 [Catenaria anguillulae PL171]
MASTPSTSWTVPVSLVAPGNSAILGLPAMSYAIHIVALSCITISLIGSFAVLLHTFDIPVPAVVSCWTGGDFASRFSFYLALADLTWSIAHSCDHLQSPRILLWFFFGYHQLMHCSLSFYTYLRVVKSFRIELGAFDWRLQAFCFGGVGALIPVFWYIDGFGSTGYWCLAKAGTVGGGVVAMVVTGVSLLNAIGTTGSNFLIATKLEQVMRSVEMQQEQRTNAARAGVAVLRKVIVGPKQPSGSGGGQHSSSNGGGGGGSVSPNASATDGSWQNAVRISNEQRSLIASQCLVTLIRTASFVYIPLAISLFTSSMFMIKGYVEPASCLFVVFTANVSGFFNARAYFTNEALKMTIRVPNYRPEQLPVKIQRHF